MSLPEAWATPVCRTVGDKTYSFRKMKRREIGEFIARWASQDRARLKATFIECGLGGSEMAEKLSAFERDAELVSYGYRCLLETKRALEVLEASEFPVVSVEYEYPFASDEVVDIACLTWGMKLSKTPEGDAQKKGEAASPGTGS